LFWRLNLFLLFFYWLFFTFWKLFFYRRGFIALTNRRLRSNFITIILIFVFLIITWFFFLTSLYILFLLISLFNLYLCFFIWIKLKFRLFGLLHERFINLIGRILCMCFYSWSILWRINGINLIYFFIDLLLNIWVLLRF